MSRQKALTDEELFAQFEDIPSEATAASPARSSKAAKPASKPPIADDDPLAELSALAAARPASRPSTPRLSGPATSGTAAGTGTGIARRAETPASSGPPSGRTSEDRLPAFVPRKSTESARSYHQSYNASVEDTAEAATLASFYQQRVPEQLPQDRQPAAAAAPSAPAGGGGWWGSVFTAASAAVKQAEAAVKDIRSNEEAMRWAEQVKGNVESLRGFGGNVRSLAMPTFTSLLQTIAPPISAHERLQIHTTHDILSYPSLDPLIYAVFARVMSQVDGGDLMVIQRGSESRARRGSESGYTGSVLGGGGSSGWTDGPWWRDTSSKRDLGSVKGLVEGTKLALASAEAYANDFFLARGGLEQAAQHATEVLNESNPVRSSDIFLAIQAISLPGAKDLFVASKHSEDVQETSPPVLEPEEREEETTVFAIYLYDPVHSLHFSTVSQSFPTMWADWLDASADSEGGLPDSVKEVVEYGGVDPREWIAEWIEEVLSLAIGVVAQRYVAKRMGVGEGGTGRGKGRVRAEEDVAGEAARAI